jgi:hypothetical protein
MRWRTNNEVTLRLWHDYFCWRPVKVYNTWVWLERVKRRGTLHTVESSLFVSPASRWTWEYQLPEKWGR